MELLDENFPLRGFLGTFLELKTERELAFSDKLPVGVGNGNEIEPLLQIIERIIKER